MGPGLRGSAGSDPVIGSLRNLGMMKRVIAGVAALGMALALGMGAGVGDVSAQASFVRNQIYPAPTAPLSSEGAPGGAELIRVESADGLTLTGLWAPGSAERPVLVLVHGNAFSARDAVNWFTPVIEAGYGVMAVEYRGYSGNPGTPDEAGLARDADAFLAQARTLARASAGRQAGPRPIWIVGHSLGGGVAMGLAERHPPEVLVTIGTFTRIRDLVPPLIRGAVPDSYRNIDWAGTTPAPWFLVHGQADSVVPVDHARTLHAAAGRTGRAGAGVFISDGRHNPGARTLLAILEAIRTRPADGNLSGEGLPPAVRIIPFGQDTASLDPQP